MVRTIRDMSQYIPRGMMLVVAEERGMWYVACVM